MDRRSFLKATGLVVVAAVIGVGACERGEDGAGPDSGPDDLGPELGTASDRAALAAAVSLEGATIAAYGELLDAGGASTGREKRLRSSIELVREHHRRHRHTFQEYLRDLRATAGGDEHAAFARRLGNRLRNASSRDDVVDVALDIEDALAATYAAQSTALDDAELRSMLMGVAAIDAGHATFFRLELGRPGIGGDAYWSTNSALTLAERG